MDLQIGEKLSGGGTGAVHEGPEDTVYKITNGQDIANEDLMREFFMLQKLAEHPQIPTQKVVDAGRDEEGRLYIQMQRIEGAPLDEMIHYNNLSVGDLAQVRDQIVEIYSQLEAAGLYHGDSGGTGNYMVTFDEDDQPVVQIIDFAEGGEDPTGETARREAATIDSIMEGLIVRRTQELEHAGYVM